MCLDRMLSFEEFTAALERLKLGKTSGCDGLSPEIYLILWDNIGKTVCNALMYAIEIGQLHLSARRGLITLIPKKGIDNRFLKNWRPITLLNTDFKILQRQSDYT